MFNRSRGEPASGQSVPIAGATVSYENVSQVNSPMAGSAITDAAGTFAFSLFLNETDELRIRVLATDQGFFPGVFDGDAHLSARGAAGDLSGG